MTQDSARLVSSQRQGDRTFAFSFSFGPPVVPWPVVLQEAAERVARAERDLNDLRACAERAGAQVGS